MKLKELLQKLEDVQKKIGTSEPYLCGGTPRDRYMGRLDNISDLDITTGDKTVGYLATEFGTELAKKYNITNRSHDDGHNSIYIGNFKIDFSSNFNAPNIKNILKNVGIKNSTDMQDEMFSRDFTCNALLLSTDLKNVIDPTHNGFNDIKNKIIKTCLSPEITLTTNKNRVIRSIYLASKLDFDIDKSIIEYVIKNPETIKISSYKGLVGKLNDAFRKDADKAAYYIGKMNLWPHIPITEIVRPYYMKNVNSFKSASIKKICAEKIPGGLSDGRPPKGVDPSQVEKGIKTEMEHTNDPDVAREIAYDHLTEDLLYYDKLEKFENSIKKAYFQGGGGVNEPAPKKKKYKSEKAIVVQPRFEEPFYRNYDLYDVPGKHGPGAGWHSMQKYKSISEFLKAKRKKLKDKYKADDSWIENDGKITKDNKIKSRAKLFSKILKLAIDFPIDEYIDPNIASGDSEDFMGQINPAGGLLTGYLPLNDFEGKFPEVLNFGRDYVDENKESLPLEGIEDLLDKYLSHGLYGLPDGVDLPEEELKDHNPNPYYGTLGPQSLIY